LTTPLLHRQTSLLEYLTSAEAIFAPPGGQRGRSFGGIDTGLLHLEAHFSHEKRMEKILAVFPRTFAILSDASDSIIRGFTEACPPVDISRLTNARQFHDFLCAQWRDAPPQPPHLRDVLACELAIANARTAVEEPTDRAGRNTSGSCIRRAPGVVLLRCQHDIRPLFEDAPATGSPERREIGLAVVMPTAGPHPRVFELPPAVFGLLALMDEWVDPVTLAATSDVEQLVRPLAEHGLVEVRG
jgi:hypothetical protein